MWSTATAHSARRSTLDANGFPVDSNFGDSFMKLSSSPLKITDYLAPIDVMQHANNDNDFGSRGAMRLPDPTTGNGIVRHLAVAAGRVNRIYVVDRDSMDKFSRVLTGTLAGGIWGSPVYFNGAVHYGGLNDNIKAQLVTIAMLAAAASSKSPTTFAYPGTVPAISANGTSSAILWAAENGTTGALHACDQPISPASSITVIRPARATSRGANKFTTPMISRGKADVGATNGVAMFGLRE
ncbi:hypothetical protein AB4Y32_32695 [Paraburkholderia phymatum]|uniref:Uncharacterized protein n=1 Tax=Paraburkholderia phymatum TaxID=148447 RepID=A0ACC6UAE0_9BURK